MTHDGGSAWVRVCACRAISAAGRTAYLGVGLERRLSAGGFGLLSGRRSAAARGFTLLELLVVMVIIGLLAGIVAPQYFNQIGKSNAKVAKAQIEAFGQALDQYRIDVGRYPSSDEGLAVLRVAPARAVAAWQGPYLKKDVPVDPWGHAYVYRCCPGQHGDYDLMSLGADGQAGGDGEAADVVSW